jgi:hypothetical protein
MEEPLRLELSRAEDPATPPETLGALASSTRIEVRRALARNPSTPLPTLLALCTEVPDDFWKNPVLDLILLDRPAFFADLRGSQRRALASSREMPGCFAALLAERGDSDTLAALGKNPATPREFLEGELLRKVTTSVASNPSISWEILRGLAGGMEDEIRKAAASNPSIPAGWRRRCARLGLAGDLAAPPDAWSVVSGDDLAWMAGEGPWFKACASLYPVLPAGWPPPAGLPPVFRELSGLRLRYGEWLVDGLLARAKQQNHPFTQALFKDREEETWWLLAPSLRAPMAILRWFAEEQVLRGEPLVELDAQGARVILEAPLSGRLQPVFSGGRVGPGQPLARLLPDRPPRSFRGRPIALPEISLASFPAPVVVPVPNLGEAVDEVSLQRWLVKPGDLVRTDQFIVTAGMDKCDADLRSPRTGLVLSRPEEGDTVAIGGILMSILPLDDRESRG